jgi:hypothetical protein
MEFMGQVIAYGVMGKSLMRSNRQDIVRMVYFNGTANTKFILH